MFQIGERVKLVEGFKECGLCSCNYNFKIAMKTGSTGTVSYFSNSGKKKEPTYVGVKFDYCTSGHVGDDQKERFSDAKNCQNICPQHIALFKKPMRALFELEPFKSDVFTKKQLIARSNVQA